jgi:hypothetical protein
VRSGEPMLQEADANIFSKFQNFYWQKKIDE